MKKLLIMLALGIVFVAVQNVSAQKIVRVQFGKGKNSAVLKGSTGSYGVSYVVKAKAGQKLDVTLTPTRGVGIRINTDGGDYVLLREDKVDGTYEVGLPVTADYEILVGSVNHRSVPFTLTVKITE